MRMQQFQSKWLHLASALLVILFLGIGGCSDESPNSPPGGQPETPTEKDGSDLTQKHLVKSLPNSQ